MKSEFLTYLILPRMRISCYCVATETKSSTNASHFGQQIYKVRLRGSAELQNKLHVPQALVIA